MAQIKRRNIRRESALNSACERLLRLAENRGLLVYQKNNTGAIKTENRFIRFGKTGAPDFYVFKKGGETLHVELKTEKGEQSVGQKEFEAQIESLGHKYHIVKSIDELAGLIGMKF